MASGAEANFRPVTEADLTSLLDMEARFYGGEGYPFDLAVARAATLRLLREPERGRIWVAARPDRFVGYLILTFGYSIEFHGVDALVDELYFEPDMRGMG